MSELEGALLGGVVTGGANSADLKLWIDREGFIPPADTMLLLLELLPELGFRWRSIPVVGGLGSDGWRDRDRSRSADVLVCVGL
jgi:hypothetical protein